MSDRFTIVKKGYNQAEVEGYIKQLEGEIEKYKKNESAVSGALIKAESVAKEIVHKAEVDALASSKSIYDELNEEMASVKRMIDHERKALADFCAEYDGIIERYFTTNSEEITSPLRAKLDVMESLANDALHNSNVGKIGNPVPEGIKAEKKAEKKAEEKEAEKKDSSDVDVVKDFALDVLYGE